MRLVTSCLLFSLVNLFVAVFFPHLLTAIIVVFSAVTGVCLGVYWSVRQEEEVRRRRKVVDSVQWSSLRPLVTKSGLNRRPSADLFKTRLLVSKNVDPVIEQLVDLVLRDFVFSFYKTVVPDGKSTENLQLNLKNEVWVVVSRFVSRIRSFDDKFLTKDLVEVVTKHVHQINLFLQKKEKYTLCAHLVSTERELEFLRRVSDLLLAVFVPSVYLELQPLRLLLREVLSVQVLYNTIESLADPDFINCKILDYLTSCDKDMELRKKTKYAFAETFDDFIGLIRNCSDSSELKRIQYFIMTEIMQATAINNLKHERGLDLTKERVLKGSSTKGDHLLSRNLPRYLNQLKFAKRVCEKRMSQVSDVVPTTSLTHPPDITKVVYPFSLIMSNDTGRQFFHKFLSKSSTIEQTAQHLVTFWESVNEMKLSQTVKQVEIAHQLLSHSYFLSSVNSHIKIPKDVLKEMENFILGNVDPLAFFRTQKVVFKVLEERYFPLFVVSRFYDEMVQSIGRVLNRENTKRKASSRGGFRTESESSTSSEVPKTVIDEHIELSEQSVKRLKSNLQQKTDSLTALHQSVDQSSNSSDATTSRIIEKLEKELSEIRDQVAAEECHLSRSVLWRSFLGEWRAQLYYIETEHSDVPVAAIIVHLGSLSLDMRCDAWVIARTMTEVADLKRKLVKLKPSLSRIEIFRLRNLREDRDASLIQRATLSMNQFFTEILEDETCFKSEEVYLFFSASPEEFRRTIALKRNPRSKKSTLPFAQWLGFSASSSKSQEEEKSEDDEELCQFFEDLSSRDGSRDDIAEPAYSLLDEVFELQDGVGWIRKSLIAFVQISYGKSINRQIHETVAWLTSDTMFAYYLTQMKDSLWPNGLLLAAAEVRSREQKDRTYVMTRQKVLHNIPDVIVSLMGESTAKQRILKLLDVMQQKDVNKDLLYRLIDVFVRRLVPELESSAD